MGFATFRWDMAKVALTLVGKVLGAPGYCGGS